MASYIFAQDYTASKNCYAVIYDTSGNVLDFSDSTFKSLASATTPSAAMTELTSGGGTGLSTYTVTINLASLNKTLNPVRYGITFFERAGGSPAPLTDTAWLNRTTFSVQAAEIGEDLLGIEFATAFTSTAGTTLRGILTVTRNGLPVNIYNLDPTAAVVLTAREHGAGSDLFTTSSTTVNTSGYFEISQSTPGYTTDRVYQHTAQLTVSGVSTTFRVPIPVFG